MRFSNSYYKYYRSTSIVVKYKHKKLKMGARNVRVREKHHSAIQARKRTEVVNALGNASQSVPYSQQIT